MTLKRPSNLKTVKPVKMWAAVSIDVPPKISGVEWYREDLQDNLRHIRVVVAPAKPTKKKIQ